MAKCNQLTPLPFKGLTYSLRKCSQEYNVGQNVWPIFYYPATILSLLRLFRFFVCTVTDFSAGALPIGVKFWSAVRPHLRQGFSHLGGIAPGQGWPSFGRQQGPYGGYASCWSTCYQLINETCGGVARLLLFCVSLFCVTMTNVKRGAHIHTIITIAQQRVFTANVCTSHIVTHRQPNIDNIALTSCRYSDKPTLWTEKNTKMFLCHVFYKTCPILIKFGMYIVLSKFAID